MKKNDIIFQSTYDNILEFIKDKDLDLLMGLSKYISSSDMHQRPPNELEKEFIAEFFTNDGWVDYVVERKRRENNPDGGKFFYKPRFDFDNILGILNFEIISRSREALRLTTNKLKQIEKLKGVLESDLDNAVFDGIFDKVEGFSNIYETLIAYNMVKERDD